MNAKSEEDIERNERIDKENCSLQRGTRMEPITELNERGGEEEEEEEEEEAIELAQQKLADLASSLMAAAAGHSQAGGGGAEDESGSINNNTDDEAAEPTATTKPLVRKARKLLFRRLRVGVEDSRVFVGKFHCLDKQGNIILYDTVEYRQISPPSTTSSSTDSPSSSGDGGTPCTDCTDGSKMAQRSLGLVLVPARCRTSCHVECSIQEQFSLLSI